MTESMLNVFKYINARKKLSINEQDLLLFISLVLFSIVIDYSFLFIALGVLIANRNVKLCFLFSLLGVFILLVHLILIKVQGVQYYLCQLYFLKLSLYCAVFFSFFSFKSNKSYVFFLGNALIVFSALWPSFHYVIINHPVPLWDQSRHYLNFFREKDFIDKYGMVASFLFYDFYTPLQYIISVVLSPLSGSHYEGLTIFSTIIWYLIAFYYSRRLFSEIYFIDKSLSTVYSFVFMSIPILASLQREYMLDAQQIALLFSLFFYVLKYNNTNAIKYFFKSVLSLVLGFWLKESFLIYGVVAIASCIIVDFSIKKTNSNIIGLLGICSFFMMFSSIWFVIRGGFYLWDLSSSDLNGLAEGDPQVFSLASYLWYINYFPEKYIGYPILFILSIAFILNFKKITKDDIKFLVYCLLIYLFFTMKLNKDVRYALPLVFVVIPLLTKIGSSLRNVNTLILVVILSVASLWSNMKEINSSVDHGAVQNQNSMLTAAILDKFYSGNNIATCYELKNPGDINFHKWGIDATRREIGLNSSINLSGVNCNINNMTNIFSINGNSLFVAKKENFLFLKDPFLNNYYLFSIEKEKLILRFFYGDGVGDYKLVQVGNNEPIINVCRSHPSLPWSFFYATHPETEPCSNLVKTVGYIQ